MEWIRKSKKCQMKRMRSRFGVSEASVARERPYDENRMTRTAERDTSVVVSSWSMILSAAMIAELSRFAQRERVDNRYNPAAFLRVWIVQRWTWVWGCWLERQRDVVN